ncbi:hypothetical protein [Rhodoferax koreensis]|uniref:hypothetical protein n=1 Tax=Rhodoferax koreensis TaxID=1842727 RepID=UPI0012FF5F0C|nr:hypothetical protein [Rhodoferax koreense]
MPSFATPAAAVEFWAPMLLVVLPWVILLAAALKGLASDTDESADGPGGSAGDTRLEA